MRLSLALLVCLLLAGCPAPKPTPVDSPQPLTPSVPHSTPAPTPTPAEPAPSPITETTPTPSPTPAATPVTDFTGVWSTTDEQGQVFNIVIFPNGQVVTNWTKGKSGAYGERGLWRMEGSRLIAFYSDGTSDLMESTDSGIRYTGYVAGVSLDRPATASAQAVRLTDPVSKFLGVWRLNKEPDGTYQYLSLQSNGRAYSSVNGGTEGQWVVSGDGAECTWPDGWVDRLEATADGWQKRSSVGVSDEAPADLSPAVRVGEAKFEIFP